MKNYILLTTFLLLAGCTNYTQKMKKEDTMNISENSNIYSANTDAWTLSNGQDRGLPTIFRFRPNLKSNLGNTHYPRRLVISWHYETSRILNGMPSQEQSIDMKDFEDILIKELDPDRVAILALVYTSNGLRKWHFYVKNTKDLASKINNALAGLPKLPINLSIEDDPNWDELRMVIEGAK